MAFVSEYDVLCSGSADKTIRVWDMENGYCRNVLVGHLNVVKSLVYLKEFHLLASGGVDMVIRTWNISKGNEIQNFHGHDGCIRTLYYIQDRKVI